MSSIGTTIVASNKAYKQRFTLEERIALCDKNQMRFGNDIVTVIAVAVNGAPGLVKQEFIMPSMVCFGSLASSIRRRLTESQEQGKSLLRPEDALFYFINNRLPAHSQTMGLINKEHCDKEDGLLYVSYSLESTFGWAG